MVIDRSLHTIIAYNVILQGVDVADAFVRATDYLNISFKISNVFWLAKSA